MLEKTEHPERLSIDTLFRSFKGVNKCIQINTPEDLAKTIISFLPIINSSQTLASLFVADVDAFMEDMGIELGKEIRSHLVENVPLYKYKNKKAYEAIKSGKSFSGLHQIHLTASDKLMRKAHLKEQIKILKQHNKVTSPVQYAMLESMYHAYSARGVTASLPVSTTRGWTQILQVAQSYMSDLFEDIMETQFNAAVFGAAVTGQREIKGLAEPWHDFDFWFFIPFHLHFGIEYLNIENEPSMNLEGTGPYQVNVKFKIKGELTGDGEEGPQTTPFSGSTIQTALIVRRAETRDYILDFQASWPHVMLDNESNTLFAELVAFGVQDYFRREIPTLPLFSLLDRPPFIFFETSELVSVDSPGNKNALTWTFGTGPNRVSPFDRYLILPGNNITLGNSAAAMHFTIRESLPELPLKAEEDGNLVVNSIDVELRNGYMEVTGKGVYHTCWCYPDVDFSYGIKILLSIDNDGNLIGTADNPDVGLPAWLYILNGLLLGAVGFMVGVGPTTGAGLGLIGTAIAKSMFGSTVAEAVQEQLNININLEALLNEGLSKFALATNGWISVIAKMRTVQITPNGVFFHGNLTTDAALSTG